MPVDFLAQVVDRWQRRAEVWFIDVAKKGKPVVKQIEEWAESQKVDLPDFWKVELAKRVKQRAIDAGLAHFDEETIERWQGVFSALIDREGPTA